MSVQVGDVVTGSGQLHVTDCPTCGCVYAIPDGVYRTGQRHKAAHSICCHRTFQQLARHMSSRHPDYDPEATS